jgi:hypothetical protein
VSVPQMWLYCLKRGGGGLSDPCLYSIVTESDVRNGPLKISYEVVKRSVKRVTDY